MKITIKEIREKFPNPTTSGSCSSRDAYCIGGALYLSAFGRLAINRFPSSVQIAEALVKLNARLTWTKARHYAYLIISANDNAEFELAWKYAQDALNLFAPEQISS